MTGPTVIKVGGAAIDEAATLASIAQTIAAAHESGASLIIVHGGGAAVDQRLRDLGRDPQKIDGVRVTRADEVSIVAGVLGGESSLALVAALRQAGVPAVGLRLADAGVVRVAPADPRFGCVGTVDGGDAEAVGALLAAGFLPVIAPIGYHPELGLLNVNADAAAAGIAKCVGSPRLVLLTDVSGVQDAAGRVIESLDGEAIEQLVSEGVVHGGMVAKLRNAAETAEAAGVPVCIGHAQDAAALIAVGAAAGIGTAVMPSGSGAHVGSGNTPRHTSRQDGGE
ncbi:MAG: acetylglutamate kinase [Planctomycetota bacterium]